MIKLFDFIVVLLMCGIMISFGSIEINNNKNEIITELKYSTDSVNTFDIDSMLFIDTIKIVTIDNKKNNYTYCDVNDIKGNHEKNDNMLTKQYYAFANSPFEYDYEPIPYTEEELNLFANVLHAESRDKSTLEREIDMYFVAICGIMRILCENHSYKTVTDMVLYSNSFPYKVKGGTKPLFDSIQNPKAYKIWADCREVAKNVLERNIPCYVPYLPYGTFCYWNDRIDTNMKQARYLENRGICIATTVWEHHYYIIEGYHKQEELDYLVKNNLICNPIKKRIKNGILCK
jgi:hypothetical protein